jgi:formylglycine-generating enzyme
MYRLAIPLLFVLAVLLGVATPFPKIGSKTPRPGEERDADVGNGVTMRFCWAPASNGKFKIGSPQSEDSRRANEDEHEVVGVDGFWMAKFPMTQKQYAQLTGRKPSHFSSNGDGKDKVASLSTDDFPVENVSWEDAQACIRKMQAPVGIRRFALPSEAQWEWAARGGRGNGQAFYWGDVLCGDKANCDGTVRFGTDLVGSWLERTSKVGSFAEKAPHPWGLCDMAGNVWNWCEDYDGAYQKLPNEKNPVQTVGQAGGRRILRGGSWFAISSACRSAERYNAPADYRSFTIGFRVVALP